MKPKHDCLGYCAYCHEKNRRVIHFDTSHKTVLKVSLCDSCDNSDLDFSKLMHSIMGGWEHESRILIRQGKWTDKQADDYLKHYSNMEIVGRA